MRYITLFLFAVLLVTVIPSRARAAETCLDNQPAGVTCLDDTFTNFWRDNGGLAVFGYAITAAGSERNADAPQEFVTQWTERNRFELHSENNPPYQILLGRMGAERLAQLGRDAAADGRENGPIVGCLWFEETGHNVCDRSGGQGFKTYWQTHGLSQSGLDAYRRSLALFGLPLTAAREEQRGNGETLLVQWFERARFEWHPDNPSEYRVQLGLLGAELRAGLSQPSASASIFGVTISNGFVGATFGRAAAARTNWVRYGDFLWSEIEPTPGAREWSRIAGVEDEIKALAAQGLTMIAVVRSAPAWAQQIPGNTCAAIKPEALDAFASFMRDLVARYSVAPYNIKYWEIWNEEDVDPSQVSSTSGFGCWGDSADPYFGGGAYAEMLKRVYPAIKQANPRAQVLMGGLLLDCDAEHPLTGRDCAESRFFEGILRNGGGAAFDIVSYHGYAFWSGKNEDWDMNPAWQARGGVVRGKLQLIREMLARYQVDKPVLLSEAGLLCYQSNPQCGPSFFSAQASYLPRVYARAWANGLLGAIWYTLEGPGWEKGGLLDENQQPRPAYQALSFMTGLLQDASYEGSRSSGAIEGYAFHKGATRYELYWVNDDTPARMAWPAGTIAAYDLYGQPLAIVGSDLEVKFNPIFIEIRA
ncbi:MAG: hypothetical protein ABIV47_02855 [Roseiflexaceae bacterium]